MKRKFLIPGLLVAAGTCLHAQSWNVGPPVNSVTAGQNAIGTSNAFSFDILTNNSARVMVTQGTGITSPLFGSGGDGVRIYPPGSTECETSGQTNVRNFLELWTDKHCDYNGTYIKWGDDGQIGTNAGHFSIYSNAQNGMEMNTTQSTGRYFFKRSGVETARIGTNNNWRIGPNFGNQDPTHTLEINGNLRIGSVTTGVHPEYILLGYPHPGGGGPADVEVQKLAFPGSPAVTLLGDGTWGTISVSAALGQTCSTPGDPAQLTTHREIPMSDYNIYFTGSNDYNEASISIGANACTNIPAKLSVVQKANANGHSHAGYFENASHGNGDYSGITARAIGTLAAGYVNRGGQFSALNGDTNIGISGLGSGSSNKNFGGSFKGDGNSALDNVGVDTNASGAHRFNYGVFTKAAATGSAASFGIFAEATSSGTASSFAVYGRNPGGISTGHWAGYFHGDIEVNGAAFSSSGTWTGSDRRFKTNVQKLESVNEKISKLNGYTYEYKAEEFKEKNFSKGNQIGLIAQEVKEVFPQLVVEDAKGYLAVNYQGMIPVLLEAIKGQQQQIKELQTIIQNSAKENGPPAQISNVNLSDTQILVLEQNVPNPFAEQTTINYTLTEGIQKAQILFYNAEGRLVNTAELKASAGQGRLDVFASDLTNGIYTYTLVVDGKIIDSKKMIKTK